VRIYTTCRTGFREITSDELARVLVEHAGKRTDVRRAVLADLQRIEDRVREVEASRPLPGQLGIEMAGGDVEPGRTVEWVEIGVYVQDRRTGKRMIVREVS
jgi:hypothetical protein